MEEKRTNAVWIVVVLLLLLPIGLYVTGYVLLPDRSVIDENIFRDFKFRWQARLYKPLEQVEEAITGKDVHITYPDDFGFRDETL